MASDFQKSLPYVLQNEGPYVCHPADPGGATNWGITLADLSTHRGHEVTAEDVKALTQEEAAEIYHLRYWTPLQLDAVSDPDIATAVFDICVNRGPHGGMKLVQEACKIRVDGAMGPLTLGVLNTIGKTNFLLRLTSISAREYVRLAVDSPRYLGFLPGWNARAFRLLSLIDGVVL